MVIYKINNNKNSLCVWYFDELKKYYNNHLP